MNTSRMNAKFNPPPKGPCQRRCGRMANHRVAAIGVPDEQLCERCVEVWNHELRERIEARA